MREIYNYWCINHITPKSQIDFYGIFEDLKNSIKEFDVPSKSAMNGKAFKVSMIRKLKSDTETNHLNNIRTKTYQGAAFQPNAIDHDLAWNAAKSGVSTKTLEFARKAKINVNPTGVNKSIWFKTKAFCKICKDKTGSEIPQTLPHILGSCCITRGIESENALNTVTWRHNQILEKLVSLLKVELSDDFKILVDLPNHPQYYESFPTEWLNSSSDMKPDLIIVPPNAPIIIGELTSPALLNMKTWNATKEKKYTEQLISKMNRPAYIRAFEVGQLGETNSSLQSLFTCLDLRKSFCKKLTTALSTVAVECSRRIFQNRDNAHWTPGFDSKQ